MDYTSGPLTPTLAPSEGAREKDRRITLYSMLADSADSAVNLKINRVDSTLRTE